MSRQALIGKSLCDRFAEYGNQLADSRLDEDYVQLLQIVVDLLKHDPQLHRCIADWSHSLPLHLSFAMGRICRK